MGSICFFAPMKESSPHLGNASQKKDVEMCLTFQKDVEDLILGVVVDDDVGDCDSVPQCTNVAKNHAEGMKC